VVVARNRNERRHQLRRTNSSTVTVCQVRTAGRACSASAGPAKHGTYLESRLETPRSHRGPQREHTHVELARQALQRQPLILGAMRNDEVLGSSDHSNRDGSSSAVPRTT
jgi:hypothetical protein